MYDDIRWITRAFGDVCSSAKKYDILLQYDILNLVSISGPKSGGKARRLICN
jgi:hypothetical protein